MSFALHPDVVVPGGKISQTEHAVRVDLAAAYRLAALNGWDDLVYIRLFATMPGEAGHFLINAFNLVFDEITASNLVKINGRGQLAGDWPEGAACPSINVTGFALRAAMHATRPDAQYVIHLYNTAGIAVSAQKHGLLSLSQYALHFHRRIACHDYEGLAFTPEGGTRFTTPLDNHFAMLLRNRGTLATGRITAETHVLMATLIKTREIQIQIQTQAQIGGKVVSPASHVVDRAAEQLKDDSAIEGVIEWPTPLRKLDKIDTSYCD